MKTNNPITYALLALGLVSAASVACADTTETITATGHTYNEVFITGSTAARGNVFTAVTNQVNGVFDAGSVVLVPTGANSKSGSYTAYGTIGGAGNYYCLCFSFTGSEAGLWALQKNANGLQDDGYSGSVNVHANTLGSNPQFSGNQPGDGVIPGTPEPTTFVDPNTQAAFSAAPDLSMADTSQAVSLSQTPALQDYGIIGAVTFEWVKGYNSTPTSSWNDLVNVTDPQLNYLLGGYTSASFFTGNTNDTDLVFAVGRNRASGTHQNTMIDTLHGTTVAVQQWVPDNDTYSGTGVLTDNNATPATLTASGGIAEVYNDGFDSGGGVADSLGCDESGAQKVIQLGATLATKNIILLGYLGTSDASTAHGFGAAYLSLNGVAENDEVVENGTYSFWGHEHLYGTATEDSSVETVGNALTGYNPANNSETPIEAFGGGAPTAGALYLGAGLGGGEVARSTTQSSIIAPQYMNADKPNGSDSGYPAQL